MNEKQIKALMKVIDNTNGGAVQPDELFQVVNSLLSIIGELRNTVDANLASLKEIGDISTTSILQSIRDTESKLRQSISDSEGTNQKKVLELSKRLIGEIKGLESRIPAMPDLSYLDNRISYIEDRIPSITSELRTLIAEESAPEETGSTIVDKINSLSTVREDDKIGIEHIRDLEDELYTLRVISSSGSGGRGHGGVGLQVVSHDSSLTGDGTPGNPLKTVVSAASAGYQVPTGSVNGSNKVFVFTTAPTVVSVDGVCRRKTSTDGTVNWTGTTTITLIIAPNYDMFGLN